MIGLDLLGAAPANAIQSSQRIYDTNPVVPQMNAPAPTQAVSYYPEATGYVEDPREIDVNRDFGASAYAPQWDTTESDTMQGIDALVGDTIGTPDEVTAAKLAVSELMRTYLAVGSPSKFKKLYANIVADWEDWNGFVEGVKRGASSLYTIKAFADAKAIGKRAQDLTQKIARDAGLVPPDSDPLLEPSGSLFGVSTWVWVLGGVAIVMVAGAYIVVPLIAAYIGRRR